MPPDQGPQPPTGPGDREQTGHPPTDPATGRADLAVATVKTVPAAVVGWVVGGLGLLVILPLSFLPYYHADASYMGYSDTRTTDAWDSWISVVGLVLVLLGSGTVAAAASGRLAGRGRAMALVGGAVATTTALPFFLSSRSSWPDFSDWNDAVSATGVNLSQARGVGFFLVLLFAAVIGGLSWTLLGLSWRARATTKDGIPSRAVLSPGDQAPTGDGLPQAPGLGQPSSAPAAHRQPPVHPPSPPTADG